MRLQVHSPYASRAAWLERFERDLGGFSGALRYVGWLWRWSLTMRKFAGWLTGELALCCSAPNRPALYAPTRLP